METMLQRIKQEKLVAIVRGITLKEALILFGALADGGVQLAEITLNTPDALSMIDELRSVYGHRMAIGAGTVLNESLAQEAIRAGAEFLVSPNVDSGVIRAGVEKGILPLPGAFTPTEIVQAAGYGAPIVKLFPSSIMGPAYVKELQGPLAHIPLLAVGGVTKENARLYLEAGAVGIGVGGSLVNRNALRSGNISEITEYAKQLRAALHGTNRENSEQERG